MTAATLHIATPTATERTLLRIADGITAFVAYRRERRIERREIALDLLREQQSRKQDPRAVDHALAQLGLSRR
ncbi:hypothetical protein DY023_13985 [Microbacterium bovistercoris]|uniref:Uncharacterized protein n=1 Tax=Microbacterium bovistercoris TaxID=2293570 RepID=A0A371NR07_9MICO|nr:hypothetical protein [Microbacterium bovistercoris]REJ04550.1 hypothetical protein DY023_13985 [Microbacterium bovistercoris]